MKSRRSWRTPGAAGSQGFPRNHLEAERGHPSFTQGDQRLVVPLHHVLVQLLLPLLQLLPLLVVEIDGHVVKRHWHLQPQAPRVQGTLPRPSLPFPFSPRGHGQLLRGHHQVCVFIGKQLLDPSFHPVTLKGSSKHPGACTPGGSVNEIKTGCRGWTSSLLMS